LRVPYRLDSGPLGHRRRSGARSRKAAIALAELGYGRCYNIIGGFEGARDEQGHRGRLAGWKVCALPWVQD
jgi:rhodanese-related sulfurtransferase